MYTNMDYNKFRTIPLFLAFPHSPLLPICILLLTWNPPCCDRIRPPRSQVAHKLIFPFPSPCSYTPHSKIPTPRSFPDPNIHSLGRHRETSSQDRAQYQWSVLLPLILFNISSCFHAPHYTASILDPCAHYTAWIFHPYCLALCYDCYVEILVSSIPLCLWW